MTIDGKVFVHALAVALVGALLLVPSAMAAKVFKNCKAVNKVHEHGIARSAKTATSATGLTGSPFVSAALYAANRTKDRDHDGVACES